MIADTDPIASTPPAVRHCVDCAHCKPGPRPNLERCARSKNINGDEWRNWLVSGSGDEPPADANYFCSTERTSTGDSCGLSAKYFEPKNPKPE